MRNKIPRRIHGVAIEVFSFEPSPTFKPMQIQPGVRTQRYRHPLAFMKGNTKTMHRPPVLNRGVILFQVPSNPALCGERVGNNEAGGPVAHDVPPEAQQASGVWVPPVLGPGELVIPAWPSSKVGE